MKKLLIHALILIFFLTGCSSTNPALTSVISKNVGLLNGSYESTHNLAFSTNLFDEAGAEGIPHVLQSNLDMLMQGITVDIKQQDNENAYFKVSGARGEKGTGAFEFETYLIDSSLYVKSNLEKDWIYLDLHEELVGQSVELVEHRLKKVEEEIGRYLKQYKYKLDNIQVVGREAVETPAGAVQTTHVQVNMDLDEISDFLAFTFGDVADYEHLRQILIALTELEANKDIEKILNKEEIDYLEYSTRATMKKTQIEFMDISSIVNDWLAYLGATPDFNVQLDFYVKNNGELVQQKTKAQLDLYPIDMENEDFLFEVDEPYTFELSLDSLFWNVGQDVSLDKPEFGETISWDVLTTDYHEHKKLPKDSLIRWYVEENYFDRYAWFYLDTDYAYLNGSYVDLEAFPYTVEGNTMLPITFIRDLTYGELTYNNQTREVTLIADETTITLLAGSTTAIVNGEEVEMPVAPEVKDGSLHVPVKFIVQDLLGAEVEWDSDYLEVYIQF